MEAVGDPDGEKRTRQRKPDLAGLEILDTLRCFAREFTTYHKLEAKKAQERRLWQASEILSFR